MIPQHREEPLCQRELFRLASADCLRPGGVELTERGLAHCAFGGGERVADLGCGPGVTLALLAERRPEPRGDGPFRPPCFRRRKDGYPECRSSRGRLKAFRFGMLAWTA